jgi:hypothetical protein
MSASSNTNFFKLFSDEMHDSNPTKRLVEPRRVELLSLTAPVKALLPSRNHPAPAPSIGAYYLQVTSAFRCGCEPVPA